jgi:GT2 family glycosyltransferase
MEIAVLIACYNRKEKTIHFLDSLVNQNLFDKLSIDIYLLDDNSPDQTAIAVQEKFPFVNIMMGTGDFFWVGGMLAIWKQAIAQKNYDLFFLFNDDVLLFDNALEKLISVYNQQEKKGIILIGSTLDEKTNEASYGGYKLHREKHSKHFYVYPDENLALPCHMGNANIMLIDAATVGKIGIFSELYIHVAADYDYTLTAYKAGLEVLIAPGYYGYCENDHGDKWMSGNSTLKERIKYLYSTKGLAYGEYITYIKRNFPSDYFLVFIKLWLKTLFPFFWDKRKKRGMES